MQDILPGSTCLERSFPALNLVRYQPRIATAPLLPLRSHSQPADDPTFFAPQMFLHLLASTMEGGLDHNLIVAQNAATSSEGRSRPAILGKIWNQHPGVAYPIPRPGAGARP